MQAFSPNSVSEAVAHSIYGASSSQRWLICSASVGMSKGLPDIPSDDAELGTAAHDLGEFCLRLGINTYDCIGLTFNDHKVDVSMANAVQLYVGYVRDICTKYNVNPMLEERVIMFSVRNDVFGTSDCIFIIGDWLFVIDYKHGYDLVDVVNNTQALHYAVSTLDTFQLWQSIKHVKTVIVQPHGDHKDGAIRECDYTIDHLIYWQQVFKEGVRKSDEEPTFKAGTHCKHCPAMDNCRARFYHTVNHTYLDKNFNELTNDELTSIFKETKIIEKHLSKVKDKVIELMRKGEFIDGYKLVKAVPKTKCIDEKGFVREAAAQSTREESEFYNLKLKSKTDCKHLVQGDDYIINKFFKRPDTTAIKVVPITDNRPAISVDKPSAVGVFTSI